MDYFNEQIKKRIKNDNKDFSKVASDVCDVIKNKYNDFDDNANDKLYFSLKQIARFYTMKNINHKFNGLSFEDKIDSIMHPLGVMYNKVRLTPSWYKDGMGPLLAADKNNEPIALIPCKVSGYKYYDNEPKKYKRVTEKKALEISEEAFAFYKPFPQKELKISSLITYIIKSLSLADYIMIALVTLIITLIAYLSPILNKYIFSYVIQTNNNSLLLSLLFVLLGITTSIALFETAKSLIMSRLKTKLNVAVESATMMRILSLPANFFREYSAGELFSRTQQINSLCTMLEDVILNTGLTSVFSLVYIGSIFKYAPELTIPSIAIFLSTSIFMFISVLKNIKINKKRMIISSKQSGLEFSLISGIQKLKYSGSEKRAFTNWMKIYKKNSQLQYNPPTIIKLYTTINTAITLIGTIIIYYLAVISNVSVGDYMAFNVSYGMVSGAFTGLIGIALQISNFKPILELIEPLIKVVPENIEKKKTVENLSGDIEMNNVSFRYKENLPMVLKNLSLKIKKGQYIAIVGRTGCGKSTLLRILLGFENPTEGKVYYDGKDIETINLTSLRKRIGVVLQDSKLFQGDIYSNITISGSDIPIEDVWKAAQMVGIDKDIKNMPMGMNTVISEAANGAISGGQRQRIMIARAIVKKPNILFLDEATSALDNITQKKISDSLNKLNSTRIVIAHRLSTIKQCDRIIMLEDGEIVEDGTYEDLISKNGEFASLVKRQMINEEVHA